MRLYRPTYKDRKGRKKTCNVWWCQAGVNGRDRRFSTGQSTKKKAMAEAERRLGEMRAGLEPANPKKIRWADLVALIKDDYAARKNRSTKRLEYALDHLEAFFGDYRAVNITPDAIRTYQRQRQEASARAGTVNREVSYLRRMLRLTHRYGKLARVPYVPMLEEPAARDVTLEGDGELTALIEALPEHHRGWVALAACTGWRKRAILTRTWAHIRTDASGQGWLHLDRRSSKNKEPYRFPVVGDVARILESQRAYVDRVERRTAQVVRWMFPYPDGRPIRFPDNAFKNAAKAAGRPELHVHDLRRFAASRMAELGVPETDAMELLGMETRSIFTRYDISNGARKVRAVERLAGALDAEPKRREVAGLRVRHG
jgi:integrase